MDTTIKRAITLIITISFFIACNTDYAAGAGKKKASTKPEPEQVMSVDINSLNERINALISLTATQEKEIQRLSKLVETLESKLQNTTNELHITKQERDTLAKQVQIMTERIKVIQQTISGIPETSLPYPQPEPQPKAQLPVAPTQKEPARPLKSTSSLPVSPDNTPLQQANPVTGGPLLNGSSTNNPDTEATATVSNNRVDHKGELPVQRATNQQQKDTYKDNENLHMSLARAAASTGQPVYIQQGQYSLVGEPIQGDRCNATVVVKQGDSVIREKRYNICSK